MKKCLAILLSAVLMCGVLSGCGGSGEDGSELTYAYNGELGNLDPNMRDTDGAIMASMSMFDTLLDPYSGEYESRVAERYEVSEDGITYTFYLRDGVTFHDGTAVTAADVKYSIENNMNSPLHAVYSDGLKEINVIDDKTVEVIAEDPNSLVLYNLAHIYILPSELHSSMTSEEFAKNPIGCGPYKFVSKNVSGEIVMEAYEDYYRGAASIKHLKGYSYSDDYSRSIALENGEVDIARVNDEAAPSLEANEDTQVIYSKNEIIQFLVLNTTVEPLDNPKVREAIAYAIDREMIVKAMYPETGYVNSILCAPAMQGYTEDVPTYEYNPDKAKELLEEAGVQTPCDLGTLDIMQRDTSVAEIVQSNLEAIGLNVTIQMNDTGAFFEMGGNGSITVGVFGGAWGGALGHLAEITTSDNIGGGMNWARYANPEFDEYLAKAISSIDESEMQDNYKKALEILQTDLPYVNIYGYDQVFGASKDLNAVVHNNGVMDFYAMSWNA